jgi:hypothetical protein
MSAVKERVFFAKLSDDHLERIGAIPIASDNGFKHSTTTY